MAKKEERIVIPEIELRVMKIKIIGDSPLITHKWSEKAKRMMLEKQMKKYLWFVRRPIHREKQ